MEIIGFNPSYWEQRYQQGGTSGKGSVGLYRSWKWRVIKRHLPKPVNATSFIDFGCGDHSFWQNQTPQRYVGLDKSPTIILKNRDQWPLKSWLVRDATQPLPDTFHDEFDAALVMDVLFHVEKLEDARTILANAGQTAEYVFARNWNLDHRHGRPDEYQAYHSNLDLVDAIPTHELKAVHPSPWYAGNASSLLVWKRR